ERPTISFAPVCSGCQWVLISVWIRSLPVASSTARTSASALAARPPSIISAPSSPGIAITLQPAPCRSMRPPRSLVVMRAAVCARPAGEPSSAPSEARPAAGMAAAAARRKRRRERARLFIPGVRIDGLVDPRLAQRPDVHPDSLGRAEDGPHRLLAHLERRAELAQQGGLLLVDRRLQRHERHEAAGLRVVEGRQAVLIPRVHVDAVRGELLD